MMLVQIILLRYTWGTGQQPWLTGILERRKGRGSVKQQSRYGASKSDTASDTAKYTTSDTAKQGVRHGTLQHDTVSKNKQGFGALYLDTV